MKKFTILIPTRERGEVLYHTLRNVLSQEYENLEVIVSDNFSFDITREVAHSFRDSRLKYINPGKRISMSHNWEYALSHASGEWVTVLGDDDGLCNGALSRIHEIALESNTMAIRSESADYLWPNKDSGDSDYGIIGFGYRSDYDIRDTKYWLSKVIRGKSSYSNLPILYNGGFANMEAINQIKLKTGSFFKSSIPDVYSAIALSIVLDKFVYCYHPIAINGASKFSTGSGSANFSEANGGKKTSPKELFWREGNMPIHPYLKTDSENILPPSIQALVFDGYLNAFELRAHLREETSLLEQRDLILRDAGQHHVEIEKWVKDYERKHNLAPRHFIYVAIIRQCNVIKVKISRVISGLRRYSVIGSKRLPLNNVYDAGIVISTILYTRPSIALNIIQRFFKKFH